jgi:hypothetical protein
MELRLRESAITDLKLYIANYANSFFELYQDSGLSNEGEIMTAARQNADNLYDLIFRNIAIRLSPNAELGRKKLPHIWEELNFYVGSRLVIVYYSEDRKMDTRWVESVSIDRKPIIF